MRLFNSIQLVALFAAMPFLISWLDSATFRYAGAAFWVAVIVYLVEAIFMTAILYANDKFWDK